MGYTERLRKVGGAVMLAIPKPLLDALQVGPDAAVGLSVEAGRLLVEPHGRKRYSLDELLAQCDPAAPFSDEERAWLESPPIGREII